eukprot:c15292_g1_i2.p1 GENE.c15292_g1_i2~~c15292_g1_i2.p1  ORF type:complete len:137 (-),score=33.59 c15292_g1_i2:51-425(-)
MFRLLWSNESGLSKAVQNGSAEKVLAILTTTPSLKNKEIKCGDTTSTAIHLAAEFGKVAVVAVLCEMGCDTNKQNERFLDEITQTKKKQKFTSCFGFPNNFVVRFNSPTMLTSLYFKNSSFLFF